MPYMIIMREVHGHNLHLYLQLHYKGKKIGGKRRWTYQMRNEWKKWRGSVSAKL